MSAYPKPMTGFRREQLLCNARGWMTLTSCAVYDHSYERESPGHGDRNGESLKVRTANSVDPPFSSTSFFASPQTSHPSFASSHSFSRMLLSSLFLTLAACAIGLASAAVTPHALARRSSHHGALQPFQKRASGQFTYFAVGMGACGKQNTDDDFVSVPLSFAV